MVIIRAKDNFGNVADLDVLQEAELRCDVSAIESGDIGRVFGISSQEFMLPGTDNNNQFFGNIFDLGAEPSVALNHTVFASLMVDGNEIFSGKMYINNVLTDDEGYVMYKTLIINETIDFNTRIENIYMNELDLSSLDHDLTLANITGSWDGDLVNGDVVYPLVDYGSSPISNVANGAIGDATFNNEDFPLDVADFKPGIKVKSLVDAIFDQVDYNYSSSFLDSDYFDKLFILSTANEQRGIGESPIQYSTQVRFDNGGTPQPINDGVTATVLFPTEVYDNGNAYDPVTGIYTVQADGDYNINTTIRLFTTLPPSPLNLRKVTAKLFVNASLVAQSIDLSAFAQTTVGISKSIPNLEIGDEIKITVTNETISRFSGNVVAGSNGFLNQQTNFLNVASVGALYAGTVNMSRMFGDEETVVDFLQGLIEKFNLVIEPKQDERNILIIEPYNTWKENGEIVDWSDKLDNSVRKSIRGTMNDQAKVISFADKEDDDILNTYTQETYKKIFGESLYFDDGDLTQGKREIGGFFSPTPIMSIDGTNLDVIPHLYKRENDIKTALKFNYRILHFNGNKEIQDVTAYDDTGANQGKGYWVRDVNTLTKTLITSYGSFHYLDIDVDDNSPDFDTSRDLNWNNRNQVHFSSPVLADGYFAKRDAVYEYWAFYLNDLYHPESKMLTCNIYFTPDELKDIQLNDKIFIDGHYYRINTIKSFDLTKDSSVEVELIKSPVRQFQFPVRRVYNDTTSGGTGAGSGGTFNDVTLDDGSITAGGSGNYVFVDTNLPVTGSGNQELVGRVAPLDGFTLYDSGIDSGSVVWKASPPQNTNGIRPIKSLGNNDINFGANEVTAIGNNNTINDQTSVVNIQGTGNSVESFSQYVQVVGDNNTIKDSSNKSAILQSTTSEISGNTTLSTIIGGEDTIISGSDKSVVIGQDLTIEGGNSNIVVGNFDTTTKTVKDLINTVVINPNRDLESWENLGGDDFSGRAYLGSYNQIGALYRETKQITVGPGDTLYLTGSDYAHDYFHLMSWSGGNGTAIVYLPESDPSNLGTNRDSNGYKRELRFFTDNTVNANDKIQITAIGTDTLDGAVGGNYELKKPFDGITLFAPISGSWFNIQTKA